MIVSHRAFALVAALLAGSAALAASTSDYVVTTAQAQEIPQEVIMKPASLSEISIGSATAPVTIVEYASMSCPHCAAFGENVLPLLRSQYIDTGKVRFVFREFPLDIKAAAASMVARCAANGDSEKYFGAIQMLFQQQEQVMTHTTEALRLVGRQFGMDEKAVEFCVRDQPLLDKITADQNYAFRILKVNSTPTFFINGERVQGSMPFEDFEAKVKPLLKPGK